jgi:hypothetical protein
MDRAPLASRAQTARVTGRASQSRTCHPFFIIIIIRTIQMEDFHKPNTDTPKIEKTDVNRNPPKAAKHYGGRGATSLQDIEDATAARRRHSESLSRRSSGPGSEQSPNSKQD